MVDRVHIQEIAEILLCHNDLAALAANDLDSGCSAEGLQPLAQSSHAALLRVIRNDGPDHLIGELQIIRGNPHVLEGLGKQMALCDLKLVRSCISLELDDLHAVEKGLRDRIERVRRADKKHVGQVVGSIHVVVGKGIVLFRIENFKQGAGGISVVGDGELVDLIQNHDRI